MCSLAMEDIYSTI